MNRVSSAYLASYVLSLLGNSIAGVVLPLLVLQTTGSVLATGAVAVASALPAALAGLVMGVVIDRINRRTASVLTDVVSALAVAALPLVDATVGLALGWFVLFAVLGSFGDVPGLTAREAMIPGITRAGRMSAERLLGLREALGAVVMLAGPAAGAALIAVFDGVTVLWVTAATSAAAAAVTMLIPRSAGAVVAPSKRVVLRDGWHALIRSPFLLVTTMLSAGLVVVLAGFQALVLPVYFTLQQRPEMLGLVLSALAVGLLAGGGTYAAAGGRGPRRTWFLTGMLITIAGFGAMATLAGPWFVLGAAALVGLGNGLFGSLLGVLMVERIPDALRGRVMGLQNSILTLAPALGMGGAALLVEGGGARTGAVVLALVWLVTGVVAIGARALRDLEPQLVGSPR
ncbi:MFS transporter [Paractinoplanes lichenicola]|uniref:Multidrug efflux pump Tap n=1 Tax=Paractinoplanes lichenicola TaxID=2802976 RepID=A0ABS1VMF9_9ACTN|nr:MFS transporter [Actinoplanes lichenicola]MBL7255843.1 MFS transporter [Actinoplanes lichenicola]